MNESTLLGFEVLPEQRLAAATFSVLALTNHGDPPADPRVQIIFSPVGRVVASLRDGSWDDCRAPARRFELNELLEVVKGFGGLPIYGWEFIDTDDASLASMAGRYSLDWTSGETGGLSHSISVFQDEADRYLDLVVWFDDLLVFTSDGTQVPLDDFIAGGERWWDAMYAGDSRTKSAGIFPMPKGRNKRTVLRRLLSRVRRSLRDSPPEQSDGGDSSA
ncbi:MAG: hypothetical protein HGA39_09250 [Coriobacteriia bacterium]|nr:hypothetical protein [Coriobacteriia bacterium]NTW29529.1 hypothetical protein [Coriobacteriia bacterium]